MDIDWQWFWSKFLLGAIVSLVATIGGILGTGLKRRRLLKKARERDNYLILNRKNELVVSGLEDWNKENKKANRMIWIPLIGWVIITVGVIAYYLYDDWLNKKLTTPMDFAYEASDIFGASVLILIFVIVLFRNHKS